MAEIRVYLTVTENYYGGDERMIFLTEAEARLHRDAIFLKTDNKLDVIIQEFILKPGSETKTSFCE